MEREKEEDDEEEELDEDEGDEGATISPGRGSRGHIFFGKKKERS